MNESTTFLVSLISLLFLSILFFWLYRDYRVDKFRQEMFKLRDNLFDEAERNGIQFDSAAYGMIRSTINGFIRFAHRINLPQAMLFILIFNKENGNLGKLFSERLEENKKELNDTQKELIETYYLKMNFLMVEHLVLSSPFLLLTVLIPLAFALSAKKHFTGLVTTFKKPLDKLDTAAFTTGQI